jgi:hypothetical protein
MPLVVRLGWPIQRLCKLCLRQTPFQMRQRGRQASLAGSAPLKLNVWPPGLALLCIPEV